ncbi:hypothetical protein H072_2591 [Dactylellina haptotyla CBS 200.50]|uniref:Uncharacterized protein n=1 Tax=Dactylellina haptotyla (strain CBS 200.50) TaxID=1284197 RepID=S8C6Q3_DACHA|nr:hypothetical protein H072_2591 [Dactylellina haptotyla CBS 200.50]
MSTSHEVSAGPSAPGQEQDSKPISQVGSYAYQQAYRPDQCPQIANQQHEPRAITPEPGNSSNINHGEHLSTGKKLTNWVVWGYTGGREERKQKKKERKEKRKKKDDDDDWIEEFMEVFDWLG